MKAHLPLVSALIAVLILTAGCFGGGANESTTSEPTAAPTSVPAQASEPTATVAPAIPVAETPTSATPAASEPLAAALTVEEVPEIRSYRTHISVVNEGPRGTDTVQIEGAYIKEPAAEQIAIDFLQGEQSQRIETMLVDGTRYMLANDIWMQTPESNMNIAELTLITPQNIAGILGQMEVVGPESVNGLAAVHYRGSKEIIPVVGPAGDALDVSRVEAAQLDLWVDDTYHAIIRLTLEASNTEPPLRAMITYDYTDLNSDIQIVAPETAAASDSSALPEADFVPNNELGELLGFNLMFPTGSTVEMVAGANLYIIVGPYTLDEATNMIELNMEANGYTQLSKNTGPAGEVIYLFQRDTKAVSITLSDAGNGSTRFQFATGP